MDEQITYDRLLTEAVALGASDLHVRVDEPPVIRVNGAMRDLPGYGAFDLSTVEYLIRSLLNHERGAQFEARHSADFSHTVEGVGRFRVNFFQERKGPGSVMRQIPEEIPRLDKLGAPAAMLGFTTLKRGLILVTGPTGSGKSTTLAALLDVINRTRDDHILTIEDPIEFVHHRRKCTITQREVGEDTPSFAQALKDSLREDPDVILVGEMRDLETIETAITAAETGHVVFGTLHTSSAPDTISRLVGVFPASQQDQIRMQLASSLEGIICQALLPTADGQGRVAVHEVLIANAAVRAQIKENKLRQLRSALITGGEIGMQTMDKALVNMVVNGRIDAQVARVASQDPKEFDDLMSGVERGQALNVPPTVQPSDMVSIMSEYGTMPGQGESMSTSTPSSPPPTPQTPPQPASAPSAPTPMAPAPPAPAAPAAPPAPAAPAAPMAPPMPVAPSAPAPSAAPMPVAPAAPMPMAPNPAPNPAPMPVAPPTAPMPMTPTAPAMPPAPAAPAAPPPPGDDEPAPPRIFRS